jgi:cytochrome c peroxidase
MNGRTTGAGAVSLGLFALGLALAGIGSAAGPPSRKSAEEGPTPRPSTMRQLRLPKTPYNYANLELPAHFKTRSARRFDNTPRDNPVTDAGATLGRVLFYDTRLSANNTVACGSCHLLARAFAHPERFPRGAQGKRVDRNAMSLVNLRYYPRGRFFWDERAASLEEQALLPIQSPIEMGNDLGKLVQLLERDKTYPELFRQAFGDRAITRQRIGRALAQFLRSMVSYQSKYDKGLANTLFVRDRFENFTAQENRGKNLFLRHCASCHKPGGQDAHFIMDRPRNNGLDRDHRTSDGGVGDVTLRPADLGLFKSPSLRNVELTAPYMHDGRLATLEEVIDHYSTNVQPHPNVDGRARRLRLRASEKAALVAFLKTLTDPTFVTDPKFSDPFQ